MSDLPERTFVRRLRTIALGAFAVAAGTGVAMFTVRASDYAATPLYWAKMTLILLAGVNFLVFSLLDRQRKPGAALPWPARVLRRTVDRALALYSGGGAFSRLCLANSWPRSGAFFQQRQELLQHLVRHRR